MRSILFLFILLSSHNLLANYLKCIGKEEAYIHKNRLGGAHKALNQSIINELAMFPSSIAMRSEFEKQICEMNSSSASLAILHHIFKGDEIFYSKTSKDALKQYTIDMNSIENFKELSYSIFVEYLAAVQAEVKRADCLEKEFPELHKFYTRARFIMEDVGLQKLVEEIPNKDQIFKNLAKKDWRVNCQK